MSTALLDTPPGLDRLRLRGEKVAGHVLQLVTKASVTRAMDGPPTLDVDVIDANRELLRSKLFSQRTLASVDQRDFELVQVSKSGNLLQLTFEAVLVGELRRRDKHIVSGRVTRTAFARRLVDQVPGSKMQADPGDKPLVTFARGKKGERENSHEALRRLADERDWRYFIDDSLRGRGRLDTVWFGSDEWLFALRRPLRLNEDAAVVNDVDFDFDTGKRAAALTAQVWADQWAIPPGAPAEWSGLGPADGNWLVASIEEDLFSPLASVEFVRRRPELPEPKPEPPPSDYGDIEAAGGSAGGTAAGGVTAAGYQWPVAGSITSEFGNRRHPITGATRLHAGIDIGGNNGYAVRAARDGQVITAGYVSGYGNMIDVSHGDAVTRYAHLARFTCHRGQRVARGEQIGVVGATGNVTGPHLHFEVRIGGSPRNPRDYLPRR